MADVSLGEIEAAAGRIAGAVERTPFIRSRTLSALTGCELWLKFENRSYRFLSRSAARNKMITLPRPSAATVIAMSAGNHARASLPRSALGVRA